jgi:hypothetical protein
MDFRLSIDNNWGAALLSEETVLIAGRAFFLRTPYRRGGA